MALQPQNERPFGFRDKLGYLFGDFGNDFTFIFAGSYLTLFYTDVLGVSAGLVGVLFVVARCVDAFTDVGMGRLVDTLPPSRGGRFRPWILRVCVPVALASVLMYLYFARSWPYAGKVAYMFATYIFWGSICYTAINIPYGSMASVLSADAGERASLSTFRSVGAMLANLIIAAATPLFLFRTAADGTQTVIPERFTVIAVVYGVCAVACYLLCYALCRERVQAAPPREAKRQSFASLAKALAGGVVGFALAAIGYVSSTGHVVQTQPVREGIYTISTLVPGLSYLGVFLVLLLAYPLTKKRVEENAAVLRERRGEAAQEP